MQAAGFPTQGHVLQRDDRVGTLRGREVAPRVKTTSRVPLADSRHAAANGDQALTVHPSGWIRHEESSRVRVQRLLDQLSDLALLDDRTGVHGDGPVADVRDDAPVVGDEENRHPLLSTEISEQVEDL